MGLFKKKADPISDRARALNAEIAALEAEIKRLDGTLQNGSIHSRFGSTHPRLHHTTWPTGQRTSPALTNGALLGSPVFEPDNRHHGPDPLEISAPHYNEFGLRKYDLPGAWRRVRNFFHRPAAHNPKLVSYLAAGSIKGLRPLRYEKRVARNRFIALLVILVGLLWGIAAVFF